MLFPRLRLGNVVLPVVRLVPVVWTPVFSPGLPVRAVVPVALVRVVVTVALAAACHSLDLLRGCHLVAIQQRLRGCAASVSTVARPAMAAARRRESVTSGNARASVRACSRSGSAPRVSLCPG